MAEASDYEGREQAFVKHFVLKEYLKALVYKVGQFRPGTTLNYVDGFSGPWKQQADDLSDTSPHTALTQLSAVVHDLQQRNIDVAVRCLFIEKNSEAFNRLRKLADQFPDIEVESRHGEFEDLIHDAVRFASGGRDPFSFVFIDPKGWTGYGLKAISPLLRIKPGEVLINFMTKDIKRFVDEEKSTAKSTFVDLFGSDQYCERWRGLGGLDREDAIVELYCERVKAAGEFDHCVSTVMLDPRKDRTHYHLVYATRSLKGLVAFREVERVAVATQQETRDGAQQLARTHKRNQGELFSATVMSSSRYLDELIARYENRAASTLREMLAASPLVSYDEIVATALRVPMISQRFVTAMLGKLKQSGRVEYVGLGPRERTPKLNSAHRIRLIATAKI